MTITVPTEIAASVLGVHVVTVRRWTAQGLISEAVPRRGCHPARYEVAELHRWVRENVDGHGTECPSEDHEPGGPVGACRRCHRPLIVDGRVVR